MTSMVEKVGRAIYEAKPAYENRRKIEWEQLLDDEQQRFYGVARAAIQALREPSEEMIAAAIYVESDPTAEAHRQIHRAMIDAALSEP